MLSTMTDGAHRYHGGDETEKGTEINGALSTVTTKGRPARGTTDGGLRRLLPMVDAFGVPMLPVDLFDVVDGPQVQHRRRCQSQRIEALGLRLLRRDGLIRQTKIWNWLRKPPGIMITCGT